MRSMTAAAALAALLLAPAARAEFEGVVEGRLTGVMPGTFRAQVGKAGIRSEVEMDTAAAARGGKLPPGMSGQMKRVTIQRRAEPRKVYILDAEHKSYTVLDTGEVAESAKGMPREEYTVKKLGKDKVAGFACEKVLAKGEKSGEMELCLTSDLAPEWARSALEDGRGAGGLLAALRQAGVQGYPVRWKKEDPRGSMTMELTSAKRQPVPASAFELPAGYQEQKGMPGMPPGMGGGEAQKQLEEAMKRLSPEQRKQMEQMMKGQRPSSP